MYTVYCDEWSTYKRNVRVDNNMHSLEDTFPYNVIDRVYCLDTLPAAKIPISTEIGVPVLFHALYISFGIAGDMEQWWYNTGKDNIKPQFTYIGSMV